MYKKIAIGLIFILIIVGLSGCTEVGIGLTNIGDIQAKPNDYIEKSGDTYEVVGSFEFRGTSEDMPSRISLTAARNGTSGTAYCRLWDVTNNKQIAVISFTAKEKSVYNTTSFTVLLNSIFIFLAIVKSERNDFFYMGFFSTNPMQLEFYCFFYR